MAPAFLWAQTGGEKPELDEAAAILLGVNARDVPGDAGEEPARDEHGARGSSSSKQARSHGTTGGGSSGAKKTAPATASADDDNDDIGGCWGGQLKGAMRLLNQPCAPTFVRGRGHLKNKVCDMCNGKKADLVLPASRVCGLPMPLHDAFINSSDSGVWTQADEALGGGKFRVVNNTATCVPPRLIIFSDEPPKLQWAPIPPEWIDGDEMKLFVSKGTLVPVAERKKAPPDPAKPSLQALASSFAVGADPSAMNLVYAKRAAEAAEAAKQKNAAAAAEAAAQAAALAPAPFIAMPPGAHAVVNVANVAGAPGCAAGAAGTGNELLATVVATPGTVESQHEVRRLLEEAAAKRRACAAAGEPWAQPPDKRQRGATIVTGSVVDVDGEEGAGDELTQNIDSVQCWGGQLKGLKALATRPCAPGFVRGRGHLKNKVCDMCNGKRGYLQVHHSRVCGLPLPLHDAFINSSDSGVWTQADEALGGGKFRVVNNTATCVPPRLIIFQGEPPKLQWDPLPPHWVHNGEVSFFLSSGTLVPLDTRKAREPRKALLEPRAADFGLDPSALGMSPFPVAMAPPGMMIMPGQGQRSLMAIPGQPPSLQPFPIAGGPFPSTDVFGGGGGGSSSSGTIATVVSSSNGAISGSMLASKAAGGPLTAPVPPLSAPTSSGTATSGTATSGTAASDTAASGNAASGNASGNAASGNAASGNAASGNAASGNAASGNAASGNAASGNAASGNGSAILPAISATARMPGGEVLMRSAAATALLPASSLPIPPLLSGGNGTPSQSATSASFSEIKQVEQVELLPEQ